MAINLTYSFFLFFRVLFAGTVWRTSHGAPCRALTRFLQIPDRIQSFFSHYFLFSKEWPISEIFDCGFWRCGIRRPRSDCRIMHSRAEKSVIRNIFKIRPKMKKFGSGNFGFSKKGKKREFFAGEKWNHFRVYAAAPINLHIRDGPYSILEYFLGHTF